jgi:putative Ca2+/H+ antiporter (TMEM165/GDT1 family)
MSDDNIGVAVVLVCILAFLGFAVWLLVDEKREDNEWRTYRRAHRCVETGDVGGKTMWECDGKAVIR